MLATDLTTANAVQAYLGSEGSDTELIGALVSAISAHVLSYTGRDSFLSKSYDEIRDGRGTPSLILRYWPVTSITSLTLYGQPILAGSNVSLSPVALISPYAGFYMFSPWDGICPGALGRLDLRSGVFVRDRQNVEIKYQAGYAIIGEVQTPSSSNQVTPLAPTGRWCQNNGVSYVSSGVKLVPVAATPTVGQYVPPKLGGASSYTFNAGDQVPLSFSYSFIPADVEQAVIMQVAEILKYRARIGEKSRTIGSQETASYMIADFNPMVKAMIAPYRNVAKSLLL